MAAFNGYKTVLIELWRPKFRVKVLAGQFYYTYNNAVGGVSAPPQ